MKRSLILLIIAAILGLIALTALVLHLFFAPIVLRIAVGPVNSQDSKMVATILQVLAREKHPIRLRIISTDGPVASAEALKDGRAEIALVRSDGNLPANATTVAIMHRNAFMIMVPEGSTIKSLADMRGRKLGIVRSFSLNLKLADLVLQSVGVPADSTEKILIPPQDIRKAIAERQVDAILIVSPPASSLTAEVYQELTSPTGSPPEILPLPAAEALVQRYPALEPMTVLKGTFGGAPLRPARSIETIGVTYRLAVNRSLPDRTAEELARSLFDIRQTVTVEYPNFALIEAPDTDRFGPLVVHPGAANYFDGETQTFIEQYGEWIYIGVMSISLIGSLLAALLSRHLANERPKGTSEINGMLLLLRQARVASDFDELDRIQNEADEVFSQTVERAANAEIEEAVLSAFTIALGELRTAVDDRRRALTDALID